jgi:hypothetical protein
VGVFRVRRGVVEGHLGTWYCAEHRLGVRFGAPLDRREQLVTEARRAGTKGAVPTPRLCAPGSRLPEADGRPSGAIGLVAAYRP